MNIKTKLILATTAVALLSAVAAPLCNRDGSKPTVESEGYLRNGRCVPMQRFEHTETTLPGAGSQEPPG